MWMGGELTRRANGHCLCYLIYVAAHITPAISWSQYNNPVGA